MRIVDAHLHVWNTDRFDYAWLADVPTLDRTMTFGDLAAERAPGAAHVDGFVVVQADCRPDQAMAEVDWVTTMAGEGPVLGIVAFAPLEDGDAVSEHLDDLGERPLVVGVRRPLSSEPVGFSATDAFRAGARAVAAHSFAFDARVTEAQLGDVIALADAVPELAIVLDHAGQPARPTDAPGAWSRSIAELALRPNVVCKVSSLPALTGSGAWTLDALRPSLDTVLDAFGPDRLLFGSDWPASSGRTSLDRWLDTIAEWSGAFSADEREALFAGTAERVYGLGPGRTEHDAVPPVS